MNKPEPENQTAGEIPYRKMMCSFCGKMMTGYIQRGKNKDKYYPHYTCHNVECFANPKNIVASKNEGATFNWLDYNELDPEFSDMETLYMKIFKKDSIDADTKNQLTILKHLADLWVDQYFETVQLEHRLESSPKGFLLDTDSHVCCICGREQKAGNAWFDKNGVKCLTCQKAIKNKVIPAGICKNRKNWFSLSKLKSEFNIDDRTVRQMIKSGELKPRNILDDDGTLWFQLFIERENKPTLIKLILDSLESPERHTEPVVAA